MQGVLKSLLIVIGFVLITLGLAKFPPNQTYLDSQELKPALSDVLGQIDKKLPGQTVTIELNHFPTHLQKETRAQADKWLEEHNQKALKANKSQTQTPLAFQLQWHQTPSVLELKASRGSQLFKAEKHRIHWFNALPPLVTITAALLTQNIILSLFIGILLGSILAAQGNIWLGTWNVFAEHGWHAVSDVFHIQILVFSALLLGMVGVMNVSGGTRGIVAALEAYIKGRRSTKLMASIMGLLIFFDDYANCFVIGTTLRPATDDFKISREKLAYIVDTTAAPVTTLAIVSTWIGYELGLIKDALDSIGHVSISAFQVFMSALPLRYYCLMALSLLFLNVIMKRDFGSMYKAERRAIEQGLVLREGAVPMTTRTFNGLDAKEGIPLDWRKAVYPVALVVLATLVGLYLSGGGLSVLQKDFSKLWDLQALGEIYAKANSGEVLLWSSGLGCGLSLLMAAQVLKPMEVLASWLKGVSAVTIAAVILVMTWTISHITTDIGTATYLIALFRDLVQPLWLASAIFLLASVIAFSIGSSWSAMALLVPVALPLAHEVGGVPLLILTLGAVFDGCLFGDHCSPLTDTTVLTAIACSSDLLDHVRTQLPYGLLGLAVATICFFVTGAGWGFWLAIPLGIALLAIFLRLVGRDPEADAAEAAGKDQQRNHKQSELMA